MPSYDLEKVKETARGQWHTLAQRFGIAAQFLTERQGQCPKCNGETRFRVFSDFADVGGAVCNQCGKFADGLALNQWFNGVSFAKSLEQVAELLNIEPDKTTNSTGKNGSKQKQDPEQNLKLAKVIPHSIAMIWANKKTPTTIESMQIAGARYGTYRRKYPVFAFPAIGKSENVSGWVIYHATGQALPIFTQGSKEPIEWKKCKNTGGTSAGWIGPDCSTAEVIWKVEGTTDLLALLSLQLPGKHSACTNVFGADENPLTNPWLIDRFKGKIVYMIHDCDEPGQGKIDPLSGAMRWAAVIATVAKEVRNVVLPFPIEKSHGKDLRNWIGEQLSAGYSTAEVYSKLIAMASDSDIIEPTESAKPLSVESLLAESEWIDDPHRLARINLQQYQSSHHRTIKYWKETWYSYANGLYEEMSSDHFEHRLNQSIRKEFERACKEETEKYVKWCQSPSYSPEKDKGAPKMRKVTSQLTRNVLAATKSMCALRNSQKMNAWIDNRGGRDYFVAVENGILNATKSITETDVSKVLLPHSPDWFSTAKLNFSFDQEAQCPNWYKFVWEVFNGDEESIDLLQKWFGYLLTPDNSLQKILMVIGPHRSGKGTILHVMQELFGQTNIATPTLSGLSKDFALQSLIGKTVAIITDARLSERTDEVSVTERLLSISGGDPQDISRKYKDTLTSFPLLVRFTLFSNLLPRFKDTSAAFLSRCVFLRMPNCYLGREDYGLKDRLIAELPGILNWAILGRHRLNQSIHLHQPEMARVLVNEMRSIISPLLEFVQTNCVIDSTAECDTKDLFALWERWCEENDVSHPGTIQVFSRKLKALRPEIQTNQFRLGASQSRKFIGIQAGDCNEF